MTDYNTCLQAAAAISSAIAAIAAVCVAKNSFAFQRNSLLKKANIEQILKLLHQINYLKSLASKVAFGADDKEFSDLPLRIFETRESVMALESITSIPASADVKKVREIVNSLRKENIFARDDSTPNISIIQQLNVAISALHNIYRKELK